MNNNQVQEELKNNLIKTLDNNLKEVESKIRIVEKQISDLQKAIPYNEETLATFEKRLEKLNKTREEISNHIDEIKAESLTVEEMKKLEREINPENEELKPEKPEQENSKPENEEDKKKQNKKMENEPDKKEEQDKDGNKVEVKKNNDGTEEKTRHFSDNLAEIANNYSNGINKFQKGKNLEILKDSMKEGVETYTVSVLAYKEVTTVGEDGKEVTKIERDPENDNETFGRVNWETGQSDVRSTGSVINDKGEVTQNYETKSGTIDPAELRSKTETFQVAEGKPTPLGSTLKPDEKKNIITIKEGGQTLFQIEQDGNGATITLYDKDGNPTNSTISYDPDGKLISAEIEPDMQEVAEAFNNVAELPLNICEGTEEIYEPFVAEVQEAHEEIKENEEVEAQIEVEENETEPNVLDEVLETYTKAVVGAAALEIADNMEITPPNDDSEDDE